jgi:hypothetical protein
MEKEFCPRCGCYVHGREYQCHECGYVLHPEMQSGYGANTYPDRKQTDLITSIFKDKWFYIALALTAGICFAITYFWRFSFLFLCFPILVPMGRFSIKLGVFAGICMGSIIATAMKFYLGISPTPYLL